MWFFKKKAPSDKPQGQNIPEKIQASLTLVKTTSTGTAGAYIKKRDYFARITDYMAKNPGHVNKSHLETLGDIARDARSDPYRGDAVQRMAIEALGKSKDFAALEILGQLLVGEEKLCQPNLKLEAVTAFLSPGAPEKDYVEAARALGQLVADKKYLRDDLGTLHHALKTLCSHSLQVKTGATYGVFEKIFRNHKESPLTRAVAAECAGLMIGRLNSADKARSFAKELLPLINELKQITPSSYVKPEVYFMPLEKIQSDLMGQEARVTRATPSVTTGEVAPQAAPKKEKFQKLAALKNWGSEKFDEFKQWLSKTLKTPTAEEIRSVLTSLASKSPVINKKEPTIQQAPKKEIEALRASFHSVSVHMAKNPETITKDHALSLFYIAANKELKPDTRKDALTVLGKSEDPEALRGLQILLSGKHKTPGDFMRAKLQDDFLRSAAIEALADQDNKKKNMAQAMNFILTTLQPGSPVYSTNDSVRKISLKAVYHYGKNNESERARQYLIHVADTDESLSVRKVAIGFAKNLGLRTTSPAEAQKASEELRGLEKNLHPLEKGLSPSQDIGRAASQVSEHARRLANGEKPDPNAGDSTTVIMDGVSPDSLRKISGMALPATV